MPAAVTLYDTVMALHVMAVVVAFGVLFAAPVLPVAALRRVPGAAAVVHETRLRAHRTLVTPAGTVVLLSGAYLATDADLWSEPWVTVPMVIMIVLLGLAGSYFTPRERRLAELAGEGGDDPGLRAQMARVYAVAALLVLVAIFFMVAKPGG
jgi:uncharacterized membrane protein